MFKAPTFDIKPKKMLELSFVGGVAAGAFTTMVSRLITFPFRVVQAKMVFDDTANNLVQHAWYVSRNRTVSTTGPPPDENIFSHEGATAYYIGDSLLRVVNSMVEYKEVPLYLKLYTFNGLGVAYNVNCAIVIQEL